MDIAKIYSEGVLVVLKILAKEVGSAPAPRPAAEEWKTVARRELPAIAVSSPKVEMATTAETVDELKRRLGKELYRMELDLANGGRIAGKPCDCLSKKHRFGLEATAEELMSYVHDPVHGQVISWLDAHGAEFEPAEIAKHDPEHYRAMIPEVRAFRKQVMGTESLASLLNAQEKQKVMEKMMREKGGGG